MSINYGTIDNERKRINDLEHKLCLARLDGYRMCLEWIREHADMLCNCKPIEAEPEREVGNGQ